MIRECDGSDPNLVGEDGEACRCGRRFDDVDRMVIWPHAQLWTQGMKQEAMKRLAREHGIPF